ncbi:MAG TPA: DUF6249 domain-containing protein, partial [Steroidobacteraceae bacterium]|nr:DUF6249 domain-containing protein [Steroidobacteraceae bacterium]
MEYKIFVFIGLAVSVALIVCVRLWMLQRQQAQAQESVRRVAEQGVQLTPELIRSLGVRPPSSDLKRGAIYLAVAAGCVIFGIVDAYEDGASSSLF